MVRKGNQRHSGQFWHPCRGARPLERRSGGRSPLAPNDHRLLSANPSGWLRSRRDTPAMTMTEEPEKAPPGPRAPEPAPPQESPPAQPGVTGPAFHVRDLSVFFGRSQVLKGVSLDIA